MELVRLNPVLLLVLLLLAAPPVASQQAGEGEEHPPLWSLECTNAGCQWKRGEIVLDVNWRWLNKDGQNCYTDDATWDQTFCPNPLECAKKCAAEGADYSATYGIKVNYWQDELTLKFATGGRVRNEHRFTRILHGYPTNIQIVLSEKPRVLNGCGCQPAPVWHEWCRVLC